MEGFIAFGILIVVFLGLLALGAWSPRTIQEITGEADQRRWAAQAEIESRDVAQMIDAQNDSRRRRGKTELTQAEIVERARSGQRESLARAGKVRS
jgi:hypothetical protein